MSHNEPRQLGVLLPKKLSLSKPSATTKRLTRMAQSLSSAMRKCSLITSLFSSNNLLLALWKGRATSIPHHNDN